MCLFGRARIDPSPADPNKAQSNGAATHLDTYSYPGSIPNAGPLPHPDLHTLSFGNAITGNLDQQPDLGCPYTHGYGHNYTHS